MHRQHNQHNSLKQRDGNKQDSERQRSQTAVSHHYSCVAVLMGFGGMKGDSPGLCREVCNNSFVDTAEPKLLAEACGHVHQRAAEAVCAVTAVKFQKPQRSDCNVVTRLCFAAVSQRVLVKCLLDRNVKVYQSSSCTCQCAVWRLKQLKEKSV